MSPGKLAAQVSHASIAFLIEKLYWGSKEVVRERDGLMYHIGIAIDRSLFHNWIAEAETKVVCGAKNKKDLLKAVKMAEELGWEDQYGMKEMCEDSWNWQQKNPNGYR